MPLTASITVPAHPHGLEAAAEGLTGLNFWLLTEAVRRMQTVHGGPLPTIYESGVVYRREEVGAEDWYNVHQLLDRGAGDCEDLAAWRAAECRCLGDMARVRVIPANVEGGGYHAVVEHEDGTIEDPSLICLDIERQRNGR